MASFHEGDLARLFHIDASVEHLLGGGVPNRVRRNTPASDGTASTATVACTAAPLLRLQFGLVRRRNSKAMTVRVEAHEVSAAEVHLHGLHDDGNPLPNPLLVNRIQGGGIGNREAQFG